MIFYRLTFAFRGTNYYGWQRQVKVVSVQQTMEEVFRRLLKDDSLCLNGCSRTDTGVHACCMSAGFHTETEICIPVLLEQLACQLPHDITVLSLEKMSGSFNAHADSVGKAYIYAVQLGRESLFLKDLVWSWQDVESEAGLAEILKMLEGTHDFRSFTGKQNDANTVRTIYRTEVRRFGPVVCFYLSGSGFLYKMVRRIAALLHEIACGRVPPEEIGDALEHPGRVLPDVVAPPQGLYLKQVFYNRNEVERDTFDVPPFLL